MTMTSDFGKVKSTLGSVVPLAMFFGNIAGEGGVWLTSGYGQLCYSGVASWRWSCKMETLPEPPALFHTHQHHPPDPSQAQAHPSKP